jgi:uncharacterized membrane protein YbhN (UPF0104 family)
MKDDSREEDTNFHRTGIAWKSVLASALGYTFVAIFLAYCIYYLNTHRQELSFISKGSLPEIGVAACLVLASLFTNAFQLRLFFNHFGLSLRFIELVALTMSMCLGNLVLPMRGGTAIMAIYLKSVHGFNISAFAVIYAGVGLLMVLVNTGLALCSLAILNLQLGFFHLPLTIVLTLLFAFCVYLSVFPPPVTWKRTSILRPVLDAINAWYRLTLHRALLTKLTIWFALGPMFVMGAFYFIYKAFAAPLPWSAVLITSSLGNLANLAPIVPGSLGIYDAVTIQVPQIFGLDTARSITAALLYRLLMFLWCLGLGIPGLIYLFTIRRSHMSGKLQDE